MTITRYTAFYPSRPYWAVSAIDLKASNLRTTFYDQMSAVVFQTDAPDLTLKICRDGRILIRVHSIEAQVTGALEATVAGWGRYLDYLNAFYLFLDCAVGEVHHLSYFNLHEVTTRDSFRANEEGGIWTGEVVASESFASVFQMAQYYSTHQSDIPFEYNRLFTTRPVISESALRLADKNLRRANELEGAIAALALLCRAISSYKLAHFETSILLCWFLIEGLLNRLWRDQGSQWTTSDVERPTTADGGDLRSRHEPTAAFKLKRLEEAGKIDAALFSRLDETRRLRNMIVHQEAVEVTFMSGVLAIKATVDLVGEYWGILLRPPLGYSLPGL